jgi:hypothetical protein
VHTYLEDITAAPKRVLVRPAVHVALRRLGAQMSDSSYEGPHLWTLLLGHQEACMSYSSFLLHDSLSSGRPSCQS